VGRAFWSPICDLHNPTDHTGQIHTHDVSVVAATFSMLLLDSHDDHHVRPR
jgi:hypothetical protein